MVFIKTLSLKDVYILDVTCLRYVLLILDAQFTMSNNEYPVVVILSFPRTQRTNHFIPLLTKNIFFRRFP